MSSSSAPAGEFRIPSLDGIRALSWAIVFVAHCYPVVEHVPGNFGVTVFFFLSGFLITTLMRLEYDKQGTISFKQFYLRRVLRILPPFYFVFVATILLTHFAVMEPVKLQLKPLVAQAFHFMNYWVIFNGRDGYPQGTGVFWSIAVEEHFYFLFPFIYLSLRSFLPRPRTQALVLAGLCIAIFFWRVGLVQHWWGTYPDADRTYEGSDARFDGILWGCVLAIWNNPMLDAKNAQPLGPIWKWVIVPAMPVIQFLTMIPQPEWRNGELWQETFRYSIQSICLIPIFIAAIRHPEWIYFRPLNWKPMVFIGTLSYSLYLTHNCIIYTVRYQLPGLNPWLQIALALALTVALSYAMYRLIEKPCAALRKKLSRVFDPPPAPRPAAAAAPPAAVP
jgi:peptidoglycan/LPS O-acetylase OafA/YrhL